MLSIFSGEGIKPPFRKGGLGGFRRFRGFRFLDIHHHPRPQSPARPGQGLPGAVGVPAQQQKLNLAARVSPASVQPGGDDPALVEDHHIAGTQVLQQVGELPVFQQVGVTVHDQEP